MKVTPTLRQLLANELPHGFVRDLLNKMPLVYKDSYETVKNDPNLGEEQANYVMGYYRRGASETLLQRLSAEHGLKLNIVQPENGGCKHIRVRMGRFAFVMCHVQSRAGFPSFSENRVQASSINEFLSQSDLFVIESSPKNEELFGVLVHTEQTNKKDTFDSIHIGFPNHKFDSWIEEPIDLMDILDQQAIQNSKDLSRQSQDAEPTLKTDKTNKKINGED
ncbi:hypothetical protein JCM14076_30250 [Methylosoma difficile]